ncbi:CCT6 [Lepeophtheirus salmonis]|uniref:CCT6 n=1 Tax=Lepeophtheirus salmonis TaxID=72036 RepID=A0A7R8HCI0_LEPSM|nr:CCT6 [Lepeophtheirus salmonis]CAF2992278.1 CCT6 [Lepeophtheirus salmonis]
MAEMINESNKTELRVLDDIKIPIASDLESKKQILASVVSTSLQTKVQSNIAKKRTDICINYGEEGTVIDLHMVELMEIQHRFKADTFPFRDSVIDHGSCHPEIPTKLTKCYILTCNTSLEYFGSPPKYETELLAFACHVIALNTLNGMNEAVLGYDDHCPHDGANTYTLSQMEDAVRDGINAVRNAIKDGFVITDTGAFEGAVLIFFNQASRIRDDYVAKKTL